MSDNSIDDIIRMAGEHLRALLLKAYEAGRVDGEASDLVAWISQWTQ